MGKPKPFQAAQNEAAQLERQADYGTAREKYAPYLGDFALTGGDEQHNRYNALVARTQTGHLFALEALHAAQPGERLTLIDQAAQASLNAMHLFHSIDASQISGASFDIYHTASSPRTAWLNAGVHAMLQLANFHTVAAINQNLDWRNEGPGAHADAVDAYTREAYDIVVDQLGSPIRAVTLCVAAVRNAVAMNNPRLAQVWRERAEQTTATGRSTLPTASRRESIGRELDSLRNVVRLDPAREALATDLGLIGEDVRLITDSPHED